MPITCPNCATTYQVSSAALGPAGRSVRCARCQQTWFATDVAEPVEPEPVADVAEVQPPDVAAFSEALSDVPVAEPAPPAPAAHLAEHGSDLEAVPPPSVAIADETDSPASPPPPSEPAHEDIESVAARRASRQAAQQRRRRQTVLSSAVLALIAVNLGLIGWRTDVVRWLPQTASLYAAIGLPVNVRGLIFKDVMTEKETRDDNVQVLVVEGAIVNNSKRAVAVPRLRFALHSEIGHEIYSWTALPDRDVLMAGEALPFRSRLASPPREGHQVLVRFFSRRDLVAGTQ